jgi:dTDP-glucose 4,6-dehydratase
MKQNLNVLITGGAGFIGSHVVEFFAETYPEYTITVMDSLTYAANLEFYDELVDGKYPNVKVYHGDIRNSVECRFIMKADEIDAIIHLAAESHVDNSIENANVFVETNVMGTLNLLNAAKEAWGKPTVDNIFYHISTDEVYGHLSLEDPAFTEDNSYNPRSPYSASKASSDHFVRAFHATHGLPVVISNCSNNYGERQHKEKLLPKTITNLLTGKKIPVYGKGENIRDWLYVKDHVDAINTVFRMGAVGGTYNIGGDSEWTNIDIVMALVDIYCEDHNIEANYGKYIEFVEDRKGHDFRYAINHDKITRELGWKPKVGLTEGLKITYDYYKNLLK